MEGNTLRALFTWIVSSGGAGYLAFELVARVPWLDTLQAEIKRYVALLLAAVIAVATWFGMTQLLYIPRPTTTIEWIEAIATVAMTAATMSQIAHARAKLNPVAVAVAKAEVVAEVRADIRADAKAKADK